MGSELHNLKRVVEDELNAWLHCIMSMPSFSKILKFKGGRLFIWGGGDKYGDVVYMYSV